MAVKVKRNSISRESESDVGSVRRDYTKRLTKEVNPLIARNYQL